MNIEKQPLTLTVNGKTIGPVEVPLNMPMVDFLHEHLNLTGTRFGCGQGVCHACTVVEVGSDGSMTESRTCVFTAHYFNKKSIITVEGQAQYDEQGKLESLSPVQQAFIDHFAFQCGYCAPGFVTGATVFIDGLKRQPVRRENLESAIEDALNEHICRCTGYVRYYKAVKEVALATPGCVID